MPTPIEVKPRDGYKIWLRYEDGVEGEVDLSDVAGKGVFAAWDDRAFFESVKVNGYRAVRWGEDIDVCSDAIYMEITGKTVDEVLPVASGRGAIPVYLDCGAGCVAGYLPL